MSIWNGNPRAVVPSHELQKSRDVLTPTEAHCTSSPYPFGIGVYAVPPKSSPKPKYQLRLLYVSAIAAADRSPDKDVRNGPGVYEGWYVMVQPDTAFEIRVSKVNERAVGDDEENGYGVMLDVDGVPTKERRSFAIQTPRGIDCSEYSKVCEHVFRGFAEGHAAQAEGHYVTKQLHRGFKFAKVDTATGFEETHEQAGTIQLNVDIGKMVHRTLRKQDMCNYDLENVDHRVSEKVAAKYGKAVKVVRDEKAIWLHMWKPKLKVSKPRLLPEASITLFVREESWLRSRRLVDDDGHPCTYEMFRKLIETDNGKRRDTGRHSDEHVRKKVKRERGKIIAVEALSEWPEKQVEAESIKTLDNSQKNMTGEIIDLT